MNDPSKPLAPREFSRTFLPKDVSLAGRAAIEPFFRNLHERPLPSPAALEKWLLDLGELSDILDEEYALRYVRMTCRTDDEGRQQEFLRFLSEVIEPSKPLFFALLRRFTECPHRERLPKDAYGVFARSAKNRVALFRDENVPLETREEALSQRYQKISGSLTVVYEGREQTLQEMARYLESPARPVREGSWRAVQARRLSEKDALDRLYDEMRDLRARMAANAGFPDYRAYAFRRLERFDYGPGECGAFHEGVERCVLPLVRGILERRASRMKLDRLRPWDTACDPLGRPPLKPFTGPLDLARKAEEVFRRVDPAFGEDLARMRREGLLDLESRKGKAPGGYNIALSEARLPFIFMNAVGMDSDVRTLLHEGGHAMHTFATRPLPFAYDRQAPTEICEVASMGMELLCGPHLQVFYPDPADAARSSLKHFEGIVLLLPWIAQIDAFQHWVYTHPDHARAQRREAWLGLCDRFGGGVDWTGLEEERAHLWQKQLHLFEHPFYYIEYGIAQLGALQVWRNMRNDAGKGLADYRKGLSLGGTRPLPELFEAAGLVFDFSARALEPLMAEVEAEIERLEKQNT